MRKTIFLLLFAMPLMMFAQDCVVSVRNVECDDMYGIVNFELTVTSGGVPHTVDGSYNISFGAVDDISQNDIFYFNPQQGATVQNLQVTANLNQGFTCDDVVNRQLELFQFPDDYELGSCAYSDATAVFRPASGIPTLSQWGIIILAIFLLIMGVMVYKEALIKDPIIE